MKSEVPNVVHLCVWGGGGGYIKEIVMGTVLFFIGIKNLKTNHKESTICFTMSKKFYY